MENGKKIVRDYGGREVAVGSYIVYAALISGCCACVRYALVTQIVEKQKNPDYQRAKPLRAILVHDTWQEEVERGAEPWHLVHGGREIALGFPDRLVVMPAEMIPEPVKKLLNDQWEALQASN